MERYDPVLKKFVKIENNSSVNSEEEFSMTKEEAIKLSKVILKDLDEYLDILKSLGNENNVISKFFPIYDDSLCDGVKKMIKAIIKSDKTAYENIVNYNLTDSDFKIIRKELFSNAFKKINKKER